MKPSTWNLLKGLELCQKKAISSVKVTQTSSTELMSKRTLKLANLGKTGDWMNHFSPELNQRIDQWIKKNMEGSDLKFTMELDHQS